MTYKIRVIGLEISDPVVLEIIAETTVQALSKVEREVEKRRLKWDALEVI